MRRKQRTGIDLRDVAIYTRKSKLTHMGDSTGVQMKQSADFARSQLNLPEDYCFLEYEDKGLSGYYADRPDFQRMLHDIEAGKIRAVVCYKLDRISRKTSDLLRLVDFFNKYDVALLVCSNNINTLISTSKIMISFLAIIAEFERDIITERIADNLIELAKDGRWMGGCTPTGFKAVRNTVGSGKNKTSITHLESLSDEKGMVQQIFKVFRKCRSINKTATTIGKDYTTKFGKEHTSLSIKDILSNPIYCTADEISYDYFYQRDGKICVDMEVFDGIHGIMAYNKTDQEKLEDEESTFIEPKFVQVCTDKPISEWIIAVGKHEGFIPSAEWIETQELLEAIADKYNRPHRATNALLGGLVYCPICGGRLNVFPESNRWTNGKPRFKYGCPKRRGKEKCGFKSIDGNRLDDFVMEQLGKIAEQDSEYYTKILDNKMQALIKNDSNERDLAEAKKRKEKIQSSIATQVRNLREADEAIKRYIQDDISALSDELSQTERIIAKLEQAHQGQQDMMKGLSEVKRTLLNFNTLVANMEYEDKLSLLTTLIERIIVAPTSNEEICHIFIKGCSNEDYDDFFRENEEEMCDLDRYSKVDTYVSAKGHDYKTVVTAPTCTEKGYTTHTCACGHSYVDSYVSAKGHDYKTVVTAPTCTAQGYTTYTCTCGHSYVGDYVSAKGHTYGEWHTVTEATCTKDGEKRRDCTGCDHYETAVIPAKGHNYTSVVTEPTCTARGYTTHTCACGHSYVDTYVSAKGHDYKTVVTAPTCTAQGYTTYTCTCGHSYVGDYVSATGHAYGEWHTVTEATCTKDGEKRRDCTGCDHYETAVIPAKGHNYTSVVTEPTCTARGYTTHTCACGHSYVDSYVFAKGHSYTKTVTKDATASEYGIITYTCQCGNSYTEQIEKLAPKIINQSETTWNRKSNASLTFRSDASIEDFVEVRLNGIVLDPAYYSVREGSTIVEIAADYLATLDVGEYYISIVSTTGVAQERFSVASAGHGNNIAIYIVCACALLAVSGGGCVVFLRLRKRQKT